MPHYLTEDMIGAAIDAYVPTLQAAVHAAAQATQTPMGLVIDPEAMTATITAHNPACWVWVVDLSDPVDALAAIRIMIHRVLDPCRGEPSWEELEEHQPLPPASTPASASDSPPASGEVIWGRFAQSEMPDDA